MLDNQPKIFNVFSFIKSLSFSKEYLYNEKTEKEFNIFLICKAFSYYLDTVIFAEDVSKMKHVTNKMKHDYLLHSIRSRNRYTPWFKRENPDDFELVQKHFKYSSSKTKIVMKILTKEDIDKIKLLYGNETTKNNMRKRQ